MCLGGGQVLESNGNMDASCFDDEPDRGREAGGAASSGRPGELGFQGGEPRHAAAVTPCPSKARESKGLESRLSIVFKLYVTALIFTLPPRVCVSSSFSGERLRPHWQIASLAERQLPWGCCHAHPPRSLAGSLQRGSLESCMNYEEGGTTVLRAAPVRLRQPPLAQLRKQQLPGLLGASGK